MNECLDEDHEQHAPGYCPKHSQTHVLLSNGQLQTNALVRSLTIGAAEEQINSWTGKHIRIDGVVHRVAWAWDGRDVRNIAIGCYQVNTARPIVQRRQAPPFTEDPITCFLCLM